MNPSTNWLDYVETKCGATARTQFENAIRRHPTNLFVENILADNQNIMRDDHHYYGLSDKANTYGRNQDLACAVAADLAKGKAVDWTKYQFLTNPLMPVDKGHALFRQPAQRVTCGPHQIFTYEFDEKDPDFFNQQLSWFRYSGGDLNCAIGKLYASLSSSYADFSGISACYSGNKSFHIHVVYDPSTAMVAYKLGDADVDLRSGFVAHWNILKAEVLGILQPTVNGQPVEPDPVLRFPESYRRLPGGARLIEPKAGKPGWRHALDIPFGVRVPQVIMWQKFRVRAANNVTALFFRPCPFRAEKAVAAKKRNALSKPATPCKDAFADDEFAFIEENLRDLFPAGVYPEFVSLGKESGKWVARFRNSATDANPSSIMTEEHDEVLIYGQVTGTIRAKPLPQPLLAMMRGWKRQYHRLLADREQAFGSDLGTQEELDYEIEAKHLPGDSPLEQQFSAAAVDFPSARTAMHAFFGTPLSSHPCMLVKASEGATKTSSLMMQHDSIVDQLIANGKSPLTMYAMLSYKNAEDKCEAFNDLERVRQWQDPHGRKYRGVVVKSFTDIYKEACAALGYQHPVSVIDAAQLGCGSIWDAVAKHQKEVMTFLRRAHSQFWAEIGDDIPVFFAVHAVAQTWKTYSPTRTMWARDFWKNGGNPNDWKSREDTELGMLVHDECTHRDIIDIQRAEVIEWIEKMMEFKPNVWFDRTGSVTLPQKFAAYTEFLRANGSPQINGSAVIVSFEKVRSIVGGGMFDWSEVTLSSKGGYPDNDPSRPLYTLPVINGHRWMVRPKYWWRDHRTQSGRISKPKLRVAEYVVVLTTEELPTAVLRAADPICWSTFSLETPNLGRDLIDLETDRSVTSAKVANTVIKHRKRIGNQIAVISNKVKMLPGTQTPISARGSNHYIGEDILQTMMFLAPEVHEEMLILNAYTGRDDCVLLHHMDAFNQTCGRNMGYRRKNDAKHYLIVNPNLFAFLIEHGAFSYARYDIVVHLTKKQRVRTRLAA
jgi:hypothetical protein